MYMIHVYTERYMIYIYTVYFFISSSQSCKACSQALVEISCSHLIPDFFGSKGPCLNQETSLGSNIAPASAWNCCQTPIRAPLSKADVQFNSLRCIYVATSRRVPCGVAKLICKGPKSNSSSPHIVRASQCIILKRGRTSA